MKEMLNTISPKVIRIMALLTTLFFTMVYVLYIYPNSPSIYNEKIFRTLAFTGMLFIVFVSYITHNLIVDDSMIENISDIMKDDMPEGGPIFNKISDGIIVIDNKGKIGNVNQGLCNMLGIQESQILGKNISNWLNLLKNNYENSLLPKLLIESLETKKELKQIERIYTRNGEALCLSVSTYLLRSKYNRVVGILSVIHDITQEKRFEEQLMRVEKLANAGQMAAELAHEIKNPICSIKGLIQIMGKKYCLEDSKYYEVITSEIERISVLLQRFLTLTQTDPKLEKVAMNNLVEEVVPLLESYAECKNINIYVDMQRQIPHINADSESIKQVIINIVQNGIDALSEKGRINISIWYDQISDLLRMEFKDNGSGIRPEHLDKIFEPFFTTKNNGSGLGLAISHKIIENHKGRLFAFNNLEGGATFVIELPIAKDYEIETSKIS